MALPKEPPHLWALLLYLRAVSPRTPPAGTADEPREPQAFDARNQARKRAAKARTQAEPSPRAQACPTGEEQGREIARRGSAARY